MMVWLTSFSLESTLFFMELEYILLVDSHCN